MTSFAPNKKIIPWIVAGAFFMEVMDETIIGTAVPKIAHSLHVNPISLKAAIISYLISLAVLIPASGWFAEKFGTRRVLAVALGIFTGASLLCGLSQTLHQLILARVLQGFGGALMTPVGRIIMLRTFEKSELVQAMNYVIIPSLLGSLSGPLLSGIIVTYFSWRWIFFINIPAGILAVIMVLRLIPNYISDDVAKFDVTGFVLLGFGLGGASYAMEGFGQHNLSLLTSGILLLVCMLSVYACYLYSRARKNPIIHFPVFKLLTFRMAFIANFLMRVGISSISFLLPLLYQVSFGWLPVYSGLLMLPFMLGGAISKFFSHRTLKRFGMKRVLVVNSSLLGLSVMSFALVTANMPVIFIILMSFINGCFTTMFFSSVNPTAYSELDKNITAKAISIYGTVQRVSFSFGIGITAFLLEVFLKTPTLTHASNISAYHLTFIIMGLITLLSIPLFMVLPHDVAENVSGYKHRLPQ